MIRRYPVFVGIGIALFASLFVGCKGDSPKVGFTITDSAGVAVITSRTTLWDDISSWSVDPEPDLRIGAEASDPRYELYRVTNVLRLPDGRIVVANDGSDELRFFAPDGTWIRNSGGTGDGPGEFKQITKVVSDADSLWVWDLGLARVTVLTHDGEYVRTISLAQAGDGRPARFIGRFSNGDLLLKQSLQSWSEDPTTGVHSISAEYHRADPTGVKLERLGTFEDDVHYVRVYESRVVSMNLPFGRSPYSTVARDGFLYGSGESYEVRDYDSTGALRRVLKRDRVPEPVGSDDLAALIEAYVAAYEDPEAGPFLRERYANVTLPATKPTYTQVELGPRGEIWLKRFLLPGEAPRWEVFDSVGAYLGEISLPMGFNLHQVGKDFVLGVSTNEFDVEIVELYSLSRRGDE